MMVRRKFETTRKIDLWLAMHRCLFEGSARVGKYVLDEPGVRESIEKLVFLELTSDECWVSIKVRDKELLRQAVIKNAKYLVTKDRLFTAAQLDSFVRFLEKLLKNGELPVSEAPTSVGAKRTLKEMISFGHIEKEWVGRGYKIVVLKPEKLAKEITLSRLELSRAQALAQIIIEADRLRKLEREALIDTLQADLMAVARFDKPLAVRLKDNINRFSGFNKLGDSDH